MNEASEKDAITLDCRSGGCLRSGWFREQPRHHLPFTVKWHNDFYQSLKAGSYLADPQLTVRRWRPCLKSLIPASLLSMQSRPPHWAITPAILYTSSSSSSSSADKGKQTEIGAVNKGSRGPLPGW